MKTAEAAKHANEDLIEAERVLQAHQLATSNMQEQLLQQHTYGVACHKRVTSLENQIHAAVAAQQEAKASTRDMVHEATVQSALNEQQLTQENAALSQRLAQTKQSTEVYKKQLEATR